MIEEYKSVLEESRGLASKFFHCNEIFEAERLHIFRDNWCCVGLTDDLGDIGSVRPLEFAGQSLILTRANDGKIRTFHNFCRHRGATLASERRQEQRRITCPYHAWSYDLKGKLLGTPHAGGINNHTCENLAAENLDLIEIPTETWGPLIFINQSDEAPSFRDTIQSAEERFSFLDVDLLRTASEYSASYEIGTNWKLPVENYVESYHVPMVHPELQKVNRMADHYQILGGEYYVGQGGYSDGVEDLIDPPIPRFPSAANATTYESLYIAPNIMLSVLPYLVKLLLVNPIDATCTEERLVVFFVGDDAMREELKQTRRDVMHNWAINVNNQDVGIIEEVQAGRASVAFDGGRFVPTQEQTSLHFQQMIAKKMLEKLEPTYRSPLELPTNNIYHDV